MKTLSSLAEIQRLCTLEWVNDSGVLVKTPKEATELDHPTEDFTIHTDGTYYLVRDKQKQTLYKVRESNIVSLTSKS